MERGAASPRPMDGIRVRFWGRSSVAEVGPGMQRREQQAAPLRAERRKAATGGRRYVRLMPKAEMTGSGWFQGSRERSNRLGKVG
jgi:hypothetical protein